MSALDALDEVAKQFANKVLEDGPAELWSDPNDRLKTLNEFKQALKDLMLELIGKDVPDYSRLDVSDEAMVEGYLRCYKEIKQKIEAL